MQVPSCAAYTRYGVLDCEPSIGVALKTCPAYDTTILIRRGRGDVPREARPCAAHGRVVQHAFAVIACRCRRAWRPASFNEIG